MDSKRSRTLGELRYATPCADKQTYAVARCTPKMVSLLEEEEEDDDDDDDFEAEERRDELLSLPPFPALRFVASWARLSSAFALPIGIALPTSPRG